MSPSNRGMIAGVFGLAAATAAVGGVYLLRRRFGRPSTEKAEGQLELDVVDALCADAVAGACAIDVAAVGPGLIELTGSVPDEDAVSRVAEVAQRVQGVHTVVNRLAVEQLERHLADNRRRRAAGVAALQAGGFEGVHSGMGARRQGDTEPNRQDDSAALVEDAIGLDEGIR